MRRRWGSRRSWARRRCGSGPAPTRPSSSPELPGGLGLAQATDPPWEEERAEHGRREEGLADLGRLARDKAAARLEHAGQGGRDRDTGGGGFAPATVGIQPLSSDSGT